MGLDAYLRVHYYAQALKKRRPDVVEENGA